MRDHLIIFRRRNATAQYLSLKSAWLTGCWWTTPEEQAKDPRCATRVETLGDDYPDFLAAAEAWYSESAAACRDAGKPTREVYMEDYLAPRYAKYDDFD